ncbi:unnamed protein product [Camellia sinensis]
MYDAPDVRQSAFALLGDLARELNKSHIENSAITLEEDCELEKKLAKKLKVKDGKFRGVDDGINMLFEGIPSVIDFFEEEPNLVPEEILKKRSKNSSASKKSVTRERTRAWQWRQWLKRGIYGVVMMT